MGINAESVLLRALGLNICIELRRSAYQLNVHVKSLGGGFRPFVCPGYQVNSEM